MFQAGQNVKLIREVTSHRSNAIEKYEITSHAQQMEISEIIQGEKSINEENSQKESVNKIETNVNLEQVEMDTNESTNVVVEPQINAISAAINSVIRATGNRKARLSITIDILE